MIRSDESVLELNIAEFLAEYFTGITSEKDQFSYGPFWDAVVADSYNGEKINIFTGNKQKRDGSFYYEYGLLKAEEEMEAEHPVIELRLDGIYSYNIRYENAEEPPVSFYFYTKTRIAAFIQRENEVMNLAAEMQEITKQKPVLCLESHTVLFRRALDTILEAYSKDYYSDEDLQRKYCPDNTEVADWMQYEFKSYKYAVGCAIGDNVGNAIDAAWNWFHTGYVNKFICLNPATHRIHLNW